MSTETSIRLDLFLNEYNFLNLSTPIYTLARESRAILTHICYAIFGLKYLQYYKSLKIDYNQARLYL